MTFDTDMWPALTIGNVDFLIARERSVSSPKFEVYRSRNNEVIDTFRTQGEASYFIDEQDYDFRRVLIRPARIATIVSSEGLTDLQYLEGFRREAVRDCPGFEKGKPLLRADLVTPGYARSLAMEKNPGMNFDRWPWTKINWDDAADGLRSQATLNSTYATLRTQRYYDFQDI